MFLSQLLDIQDLFKVKEPKICTEEAITILQRRAESSKLFHEKRNIEVTNNFVYIDEYYKGFTFLKAISQVLSKSSTF